MSYLQESKHLLKQIHPWLNKNKSEAFAQLLIRKLGSFIRLGRVLLLRSGIRLAPSGIRYASLEANKISLKP